MNSDFPEPSDSAQVDSNESDIPYASLVEDRAESTGGGGPPRIRIALAWIAIVGVTLTIFLQIGKSREKRKEETVATKGAMMQINATAKSMVGMPELIRRLKVDTPVPNSPLGEQAEVGSLEQRYGIVLLENELADAKSASDLLATIDDQVEEEGYQPTTNQTRLREIVGALLDQYSNQQWDTSTIVEADRTFLVDQLGWVGELGLTPNDSPNVQGRQKLMDEAVKTAVALLSMFGLGSFALLLGLGGFITFCVMAGRKTLAGHYSVQSHRAHLYLETFAIWMVLFFTIPYAIALVAARGEMELSPEADTIISLSVFFGSLIVLVWPMINGVPVSTIRKDIGWTIGNPIKEIGAGIVSYVSMLPLMGLSLILVFILSIVMGGVSGGGEGSPFAPIGGDGHPIQEEVASGNSSVWIGVFLLACVAAPIVEETVFRGIFYRYLRDTGSSKWTRHGCIVFACLVNGFIFAAIHPQGIIGIPILMTLAIGMSLAREWRESLIAPMTMHAINNTMVTCLLFAIF